MDSYTRPMIEGDAILDAGMLVLVGRLDGNHTHKVKALRLQSSSVFSNPHAIELDLNLHDVHNRINGMTCTCSAGESEKCKHEIAVLIYLNK